MVFLLYLISISHKFALSSRAEDESTDLPDFAKMRVKELNALLEDRGVTCNGCAEKSDLVKRVKETYHLPIQSDSDKSESGRKAEQKKTDDREPLTDEKLDEILKSLGGAGKGYKVFRPDDFKNLKKGDREKKYKDEF
jgi:hypothetical protein